MSARDNESPPAVGPAEGQCIAVGANAGAAYRGGGAAGKGADPLPPGFTRPPIWELAKRDGLLIAGEREFKGARFFEFRLWASDGAMPTAKGVTMPLEAVAELALALTAYATTLPALGAGSGPEA